MSKKSSFLTKILFNKKIILLWTVNRHFLTSVYVINGNGNGNL